MFSSAYTMESVQAAVEGNFLEAGRGTFEEGRGGWNMVAVSEPRGMSYNDAKLQFSDVKVAMSQRSGKCNIILENLTVECNI